MREYLARALERSGYEVVSVDRGTEAVPLAWKSEHFDLLLTDIVMPEMDGIELARHCSKVSPSDRSHVHHGIFRRRACVLANRCQRENPVQTLPSERPGARSRTPVCKGKLSGELK